MSASEIRNVKTTEGEGRHRFWAIPGHACYRCETMCMMPAGIAAERPDSLARMVVRYICPNCRLVADVRYHDGDGELGPFEDRFVVEREGLESAVRGTGINTVPYPAGPSDLFERTNRKEVGQARELRANKPVFD